VPGTRGCLARQAVSIARSVAVREAARFWMSPSWGLWHPNDPLHQGGHEHALPVGDTDPRARENMRRKPRQDASRAVAVHTRDRTVPQPAETVVRRSRQVSQVHPQTREKDALGDALLFEVKESLWTRIARPAKSSLSPGMVLPKHHQAATAGQGLRDPGSGRNAAAARWHRHGGGGCWSPGA
jgi:hypothetical protein